MSLAKLPAILLLGVGIHVSTTPPNPATANGKRNLRDGPGSVHLPTLVLKIVYWVHAFLETIIIIGAHWKPQSTLYTQIVHYLLPYGNQENIFLSPAAAMSAILGGIAGIIRYLSFKELGRFFTPDVTIQKDQKIIKMGPYEIVRHPGYMGVLLLYPAMVVYYTAPGSLFRESQVHGSKGAWVVIFPLLIPALVLLVNIVRRVKMEDDMLKHEFGKEWEEWASKVRYKLFPGVY